jgi:microsomal dipeptidase-like Zn-dependent dipeptidase
MNEVTTTNAPLRRNVGVATAALIASGGTLVCCVLPAAMVALGAGASLAGLVSAVPQLIWLSTHKAVVFGSAFALLAISGILLWRARGLPCPADPHLARACTRLRRTSLGLWFVALSCASLGALFAFVLPL